MVPALLQQCCFTFSVVLTQQTLLGRLLWEENIWNYCNIIYYLILKWCTSTLGWVELPWICNGVLKSLMTIVFLSISFFASNRFCFIQHSWNVICQLKVHDRCRLFVGLYLFVNRKLFFCIPVHSLCVLLYSSRYWFYHTYLLLNIGFVNLSLSSYF